MSLFHRSSPSNPPPRPPRPAMSEDTISCRATNPLSIHEDIERVFVDERQAKATTATRLFRNTELFNALRRHALAEYFARSAGGGGKEFSLWSAGCSSGEEVYSLAMVALDGFARQKIRPRAACFGTDINTQRIAEARQGLYGRPTPAAFSAEYWTLLRRYAAESPSSVQMGPELMAACKFMLFDMRKKPRKHTFDFIVCNHVLQYYDAPGQKVILDNLLAVLRPGGLLYLEGITADIAREAGLEKMPASNLYRPG